MLSSKWATNDEDEKPAQPSPTPVIQQAETPAAAAEVTTEQAPPQPLPVDSYTAPTSTSDSYNWGYADPSIDPFAQTAGTDDLFFDDDFVPVSEPVVEPNPVEQVPTPEPAEVAPPTGLGQSRHGPPQQERGPINGERGGRGNGRARGKGARGRGGGRGGAVNTNGEPRDKNTDHSKQETTTKTHASPAPTPATAQETTDTTETPQSPASGSAPAPPNGPAAVTKPPTSVRGDRTLTGGPKRSRLTEEELNAKLASMRSKNETLQAAHARAEADAANFEAREALAAKQTAERKRQQAERQKIERQNRQAMMGERERNRQRKLDAAKGREWDLEKEEGFGGTGEERRRGAARGAHGGVVSTPRATAEGEWANSGAPADDAPTPSYRGGRGGGRGSRGPRGGGGGRGGSNDRGNPNAIRKKDEPQHPPSAADFPELAPPKTASSAKEAPVDCPKKLDFPIRTKTADVKAAEPERPDLKKQESFGLPSPMGAGKSWADQVEGP